MQHRKGNSRRGQPEGGNLLAFLDRQTQGLRVRTRDVDKVDSEAQTRSKIVCRTVRNVAGKRYLKVDYSVTETTEY